MVSSTVYGIENLLDQVFGTLNGLGYEVWMSHKGTVRVHPKKSNFQICIEAVEKCDLFLGLITPSYGSGKSDRGLSITHRELLHALKLDKPRWVLAHEHVVFARQLLRQFRFNEDGTAKKGFRFKPTKVLDDIRVIDMYEAAIQNDVRLAARKGHWVQTYFRDPEALQFVCAQFGDVERIRKMLDEWGP